MKDPRSRACVPPPLAVARNAAPDGASRRRFLLTAGAALPLAACGGGGTPNSTFVPVTAAPSPAPSAPPPSSPAPAPAAAPVADTTSGRLQGARSADGAIQSFLGIPYAQAPVGALRLASPKAFQASAGVRDATRFGAASLQTIPPYVSWIYTTPERMAEDCLTLNVWAPAERSGPLPVIVWLHGGAWRTGATSMPLMDGEALARRGLVVVTVNFRVGGLGAISHPDLADADTGSQANWQLQDQIAALQWVRQNVAAFGGDAQRVCLVGQSAGATSCAILAQNPSARACFQKVVLLSPAGLPAPSAFTLADAATYTEALAKSLNTTPRGLRSVDATQLFQAEAALNGQPLPAGIRSGFGPRNAPIVDGISCLSDWTRTAWPQNLPAVFMNTLTEGSFFLDAIDPKTNSRLTPALPTTRDQLLALVVPQVAGSTANANLVIDAYAQAAAQEGRSSAYGDLWIEIYGDRVLRNFGVRYAGRIAAQGGSVSYATYSHAILAPGRGVPHCAELPLLFGTFGLDAYRDKVGATAAETALSQNIMAALRSFAQEGSSRLPADSPWRQYTPRTGSALNIGDAGGSAFTAGEVPKLSQLAVWDSLLGYT